MSADLPDLDAIRARADAATRGPWCVWSGSRVVDDAAVETAWSYDPDGLDTETVADCSPTADAEFIAHARTDVPALLALVESQAARLDAVRALYERRCAATVDECSDDEEMFLCDLAEALAGDPDA